MRLKRMRFKSPVIGLVFFVLPLLVSAQGYQMEGPQGDGLQLGFRFFHPDFKENDRLSFFSGLYQFSISVPVSKKLDVVGRLPLGAVGGDDIESETGFGNFYTGLRYKFINTEKKKASLSIGVYWPTASKEKMSAAIIGMFSDYSRYFQFFPETVILSLNYTYYYYMPSGWFFGTEVGPDVMLPKKEYGREEVELFVHYGLTGGYRFKSVELKAEFVGIGIVTEDVEEPADRFNNELILGAKYIGGRVQPGLFYKFYLNSNTREFVSGAFGFSIDYVMKP